MLLKSLTAASVAAVGFCAEPQAAPTGPKGVEGIVSVTVTPDTLQLDVDEVQRLTCTPRDQYGTVVLNACSWASRDTAVVTATIGSQSTTVTARIVGSTWVVATVEEKSDSALVSAGEPPTPSPAPEPPQPPAPPPPQADSGTTYFLATGESGAIAPPWARGWGTVRDPSSQLPVASTTRAKHGGYAVKYEANGTKEGHYSQTLADRPETSMGATDGGFLSGWYSMWLYVDAGYDTPGWNMLLGWMTGVERAPSPISHVGLEVWGGQLQVVYVLKNCSVGLYACPIIEGYKNNGGWYTMTAQSPQGIVPFPRGRWVHLSFYYQMAASNGQVQVWQDGVKIMDLTAPTLNTFGGHSFDPLRNAAGDLALQFGIYGGITGHGVQRLYVDDFRVSDGRPAP